MIFDEVRHASGLSSYIKVMIDRMRVGPNIDPTCWHSSYGGGLDPSLRAALRDSVASGYVVHADDVCLPVGGHTVLGL